MSNLICLDCYKPLEHDTEAESWLKRDVLFDPEAVGPDWSGRFCSESGDEHRIAPTPQEKLDQIRQLTQQPQANYDLWYYLTEIKKILES